MKILASRFYKEILIPEARCFISMQMLNESIHAEMYGLQIEAYVKRSKEKRSYFLMQFKMFHVLIIKHNGFQNG